MSIFLFAPILKSRAGLYEVKDSVDMGFIKPGKALRRSRSMKKENSRGSTSDESPYKKSRSNTPTPEVSKIITDKVDDRVISFLERFPDDIAIRIFVCAGPDNSLPLLNRRFHSLFKVDTKAENKKIWPNLSLILQMIRSWYLFDLNSRLDFGVLKKKMAYYHKRLQNIQSRWDQQHDPQLLRRNHWHKQVSLTLLITQSNIEDFESDCFACAINEQILKLKFITLPILDELFHSRVMVTGNIAGKETSSRASIITYDNYLSEMKSRLKFLRIKFQEISFCFEKLDHAVVCNFEESDSLSQDSDRYLTQLQQHEEIILEGNHPLVEYDDENRIPGKDQIEFQNVVQNADSFKTFAFNSIIVSDSKPLPSWILRKGITSIRIFQIVERMKSFGYSLSESESLLSASLDNFRPNLIDLINTKEISLANLVLLGPMSKVTDLMVINAFELFNIYEQEDCSKFGRNYAGDTVPEDISKLILNLLQIYYNSDHWNDTALWIYVVEIKSFSLVQVLMKFNEIPPHGIIGSMM
ncbi:hypothetical protein G9P44_004850 [Scheffersomyces stipitis]|nr:hypothetical protein G9P44_004850 [Scheffersomyces stipitis]